MKVRLKSKLMPYWHIQGVQTGKIYDVFEITSHSYRIIAGDDNKPYLYDKRAFDIIDFTIPHDWVYNVDTIDIGEIYHDQDVEEIVYLDFTEEYWVMPKCFTIYRNFFERYHDDDYECINIFNEYVQSFY